MAQGNIIKAKLVSLFAEIRCLFIN
jgi:hypothetical protein